MCREGETLRIDERIFPCVPIFERREDVPFIIIFACARLSVESKSSIDSGAFVRGQKPCGIGPIEHHPPAEPITIVASPSRVKI